MTTTEKRYAVLLLLWSRTLEDHKLTLDEWLRRQRTLVKT